MKIDRDRVVFIRVGRMEWYGHQDDGTIPVGGGSHNKENEGGESRNFDLEPDGSCLGYVYINSKKSGFNLWRIVGPGGEYGKELDDVLVVSVAPRRREDGGGQVIVGWHAGATCHDECSHDPKSHVFKARREGAVLLPFEERTQKIPKGRGGMGQHNACYTRNGDGTPKKAKWIDEALDFIESYKGENLLDRSSRTRSPGKKDIGRDRAVESRPGAPAHEEPVLIQPVPYRADPSTLFREPDDTDRVSAVSVADVVRMRARRTPDSWKLALVQRDEAWDEERMSRLLDSLLTGYPIGTLLLCRTRISVAVLELGRKTHRAVIDDASWQILDGQQRILALSYLFLGDRQEFGSAVTLRFFLNLVGDRIGFQPGKKDRRTQQFITWQTPLHDPFEFRGAKKSASRGDWIDLSRLGWWLLEHQGQEPDVRKLADAEFVGWLRDVDPDAGPFRADELSAARERIAPLIERWCSRWLPVQKVELGDAEDVLQVFSRANLEGVRTSAADIFFAGVKTSWTQAEECLVRVCEHAPFLGRIDALRLVARIAAYVEWEGEDIIPLELSRLRGEEGRKLVRRMEQIATSKPWLDRLEEVARFLVERSGLGLALRFVDGHLLDHGLGWAISHPHSHPRQLAVVAGYLFWGSAFRFRPVFPDRFSKLAMSLCMDPDTATFPLRGILREVHATWPSLGYRRSTIPRPFGKSGGLDVDGVRDAVNNRANLFLSIAQGITYSSEEGGPSRAFDWDHVYPQAGRSRMKWYGARGKDKLHFHPETWLISRGGNLCLLDSSINRQLQDLGPNEKLYRLEEIERAGELWPANLFLDDKDRKRLRRVDSLLDEGLIPDAMNAFRRFVGLREDRLWRHAQDAFPQVELFRDELFMK